MKFSPSRFAFTARPLSLAALVAALLAFAPAWVRADSITAFNAFDKLSNGSSLLTLNGVLFVDTILGTVTAGALNANSPGVAYYDSFASFTDSFVDSTGTGVDLLFSNDLGNELELDIFTGPSVSLVGYGGGGSGLGQDTFVSGLGYTWSAFERGNLLPASTTPVVTLTSAPEPATLALLGAGLLWLGVAARRRLWARG